MKWVLSKLLLSTVILACYSQASSQTYDQVVYERIKAIAPKLKSDAKERLPRSERHLIDGLKIKVDRRNLVNASAGTNASGRNQIIFYNGIVLTIDLLSQIARVFIVLCQHKSQIYILIDPIREVEAQLG